MRFSFDAVFFVFSVFFVFVCLSFVSANFTSCWNYSNTNSNTCTTSGGSNCFWKDTGETYCYESTGCCMDKGCWMYDGTNETACESDYLATGFNCTWDSQMPIWHPNGTQSSSGGCMMDWVTMGGDNSWGGVSEGCWQYEGNKASCGAQGSTCKWIANDQNQDPWCYIKNLADAQNKNPSATTDDIGCCETAGCWNYDGNQTSCEAAFSGMCWYSSFGDWCNTKSCVDAGTNETQCTVLKTQLFIPCNWTGSTCSDNSYGSGGYGFYTDTDSCFSAGGWYNSSGECVMPTGDFGGGSGGFMYGNEAHCWFADNQPLVCGNITGCVYCIEGTGENATGNTTSTNICANKQVGYCEGHNAMDLGDYAFANNTVNLACSDIQLNSACDYGPLPNCKWTNSSVTEGSYCEAGTSTDKKSAPPAQYCDDPDAKNNFTLCTQLIEQYMMPCKWQNETYPITNCTFNEGAVFKSGEKDFEVINSQFACTSAGGTWNTEYYVDINILKQDSWCEMTGLFNIDQKQGVNNKANCDTSCWACEFQSNGTAWGGVADAEAACVSSALGYCEWTNDTTGTKSFNGLGWCDFPDEMESGGSKDCNLECEGCNFMNSPQTACETSTANNGTGCKWVTEGSDDFCIDKTKKTCSTDCFSCFDFTSCNASTIDCIWDSTFNLCKASGFAGEICFNGVDDDSDVLIDCSDPECGFDNFCGGSSFGGNCFAQTTEGSCNITEAFGGMNCSWINDTWNPSGWCDMPGANCWKFDSDLVTCGQTIGCTNESSSMGANAWCEMNMTNMDSSACWSYSDESTCSGAVGNCRWNNNTWQGSSAGSGWCEYAPMSICNSLNQSDCSSNSSCYWKEDQYSMQGGWCSTVCFNQDFTQANCENATLNGLCEWRNMSATCQPSTFMIMGAPSSGGGGSGNGCWQYNGNETGCIGNSVTCTYKNDTYSNNNISVSEPAGWCMAKSEFEHFGEIEGNIIELAFDSGNNLGGAESGVSKEVDLMGMGMRVTDDGFNFGAGILNVSETIMCNGYMVGSPGNPFEKTLGAGDDATQFYWYLDTDGVSTGGCVAVPVSGSNLTGFDFLIIYSARNSTDGAVETKQLTRCSDGSWAPTNALITTSKMLSCGEIGGVMVAMAKSDLESFVEYNKTAVMRIYMTSADNSSSRNSPSDELGPGHYTPGTIDFGFVDCSNPSMSKDSKCKNFQKFGFNVFEECKNGVDDDENGFVDCNDPFCSWVPDCAGSSAFSFTSDSNDVTSPVVMFSEVEELYDAAFIRVDTSEPSNMSVEFYSSDSTCKTLNISLNDTGSSTFQDYAEFKPFHMIDLVTDTLGYSLANGTAYYYRIKVCDPSSNCAVSTCLNFTTKSSIIDKSFIFKIELPEGYTVDIPAFDKIDYNFTEDFGGTLYEVGVKTNTSVTKSMNFTVNCSDMAIAFYGVNILSPTKIDLSNAFICDTASDLMGMNSSLKKWNKLINDLHLGGAADYIEITIPVIYSASNQFSWTDDVGANGQDVKGYAECRDGGNSNTVCKVPVSMGFSAYTVTVPSTSSTTGGGGGGSGGAANATNTSGSSTSGVDGNTVSDSDGSVEKDPFEGEDVVRIDLESSKTWVWTTIVAVLIVGSVIASAVILKRRRFY